MDYKKNIKKILSEIESSIFSVDEKNIFLAIDIILKANRIFIDGTGRSGLQVAGFAMRLAQMGLPTHVVSETTTPSIQKNDLLIICSGSGETNVLLNHAQTAKKLDANIILYTANKLSEIGKKSDCQVTIYAPKKYEEASNSIQPMGTLFEQSMEIIFDFTVLELMERMNLSTEQMYLNHKNLE